MSESAAAGDLQRTPRVAAILAAHNRRDYTLACLRSLEQQAGHEAAVTAYVVDDGSTDGTGEAIAEQFPDAVLLQGDGSLFWGGGMRLAFGTALQRRHEYYLWLNDDTHLDDDTLAVLLRTDCDLRQRGEAPSIVVGTTRDPETGALTYGGRVRPERFRPLRFMLVPPGDEPREAETMNGNCVLIPYQVAEAVGNIDRAYVQSMGDYDYGLRARGAGFGVWVAPGTIGTCANDHQRRTDQQPLLSEVRRLGSVKGLEPKAWRVFTRRWAGPLWPMYWASPYVKRTVRLVAERLLPQRGAAVGT